jgi:hypothetical protein
MRLESAAPGGVVEGIKDSSHSIPTAPRPPKHKKSIRDTTARTPSPAMAELPHHSGSNQGSWCRDYFTVKAISVSVWLPPASMASTSALYSVPRWRNSAGTGRRRALAGRSTVSTRRGSSRVTTTW